MFKSIIKKILKGINALTLIVLMFFFVLYGYSQKNITFTVNGVSFEMIFVEGGTFVMGGTPKPDSCFLEKKTTHKITLADFFMGEVEVTQKLWHAVMGTNIHQQWSMHTQKGISNIVFSVPVAGFTPEDYANTKVIQLYGEGDNYPIYFINYYECELFCDRLNELLSDQLPEGYKFKIPTEAQWEYAARGGKISRGYQFSGSDKVGDVAWYNANSEKAPSEVGKKIKNELGIFDMSGNVCEWCRDIYKEDDFRNNPNVHPRSADKSKKYVLRGGSWKHNEWASLTTSCHKDKPDAYTSTYGFRLSIEASKELPCSAFFGYIDKFTIAPISSGKNISFQANNVEFDMIFIEGGTFVMGCKNKTINWAYPVQSEIDRYHCNSSETPSHKVKLSNFYMGKFEVTQELWNAVMGTTVQQQGNLVNIIWDIYGEGDQYPMYYVSYEECANFCEKLNLLLSDQLPENYIFMLPSEAQWEYAARGGKKSKNFTYSGSNLINNVAWWEENCEKKLREVGMKFENELGIYDMSGNVWEWCRDWFEEDYYSYSATTNPQGPLTGVRRVLRGGSWNLKAWHCRVANRYFYEPVGRSANVGFRIVLQSVKDLPDLESLNNIISEQSFKFNSAKNRNFKINDLYFDMIFVKGGTFTMGCTEDTNDCLVNEEPSHSVALSDFYIGKFQVTQGLWDAVMGTTIRQQYNLLNINYPTSNKDDYHTINISEIFSNFRQLPSQQFIENEKNALTLYGEGDNYPMYFINYQECMVFCEMLNQLLFKHLPEGYKFALPTEAQWEYAARGGNKSKGYTYSGSENIRQVAWFVENSSKEQTSKVGTKNKNELGIYDMSGNIWEWCADWFDGDYYINSPSFNPSGPIFSYRRVIRGGSWRSIPQACRVSCRGASSPKERVNNCGFRLALVKVD